MWKKGGDGKNAPIYPRQPDVQLTWWDHQQNQEAIYDQQTSHQKRALSPEVRSS